MKKVLALSAAALLMTGVYAAESNVQVYGETPMTSIDQGLVGR